MMMLMGVGAGGVEQRVGVGVSLNQVLPRNTRDASTRDKDLKGQHNKSVKTRRHADLSSL